MTNALAGQLAVHLPYLRRYARAMAGDQTAGDAAVAGCLRQLLARPELGDGDDLRLILYRLLHATWPRDDAGADPPARVAEDQAIVAGRIRALPPLRRRALLLVTLEGLALGQVASVLDISEDDLRDELAEARDELRRQPPTRILIIEDEPVIALDIATTVEGQGHSVVGIAATHQEAVALAARERPGLVLADIQLADDSSGIAAVRDILTMGEVPVIFITAFPERLLTGRRPEPTYLITKPFEPETLNVSIAQALARDGVAAGS
jgi:CheY-like chemotaxis protein